jgi:hypothetical protein
MTTPDPRAFYVLGLRGRPGECTSAEKPGWATSASGNTSSLIADGMRAALGARWVSQVVRSMFSAGTRADP